MLHILGVPRQNFKTWFLARKLLNETFLSDLRAYIVNLTSDELGKNMDMIAAYELEQYNIDDVQKYVELQLKFQKDEVRLNHESPIGILMKVRNQFLAVFKNRYCLNYAPQSISNSLLLTNAGLVQASLRDEASMEGAHRSA